MIDRGYLWSLSSGGAPIEKVFLAVMIWGYGEIGYGPHRVKQMFESANFMKSISQASNDCQEGRILAAYLTLKKANIRQLGPAFGTKVLTFFHERTGAPAILDSVVATWCNTHALDDLGGAPLDPTVWSGLTYSRYMTWMQRQSDAHRLPVCTIEQLIFEDEYRSKLPAM
jgi:hypothetical protein